jgi:hypothetical protein
MHDPTPRLPTLHHPVGLRLAHTPTCIVSGVYGGTLSPHESRLSSQRPLNLRHHLRSNSEGCPSDLRALTPDAPLLGHRATALVRALTASR